MRYPGAVLQSTLAACLLASAILQPAVAQDVVEKPSVKVGDQWTYRRTDIATGQRIFQTVSSVTNVDQRVIQTLATLNGKEVESVYTPDWEMVVAGDGTVCTPQCLSLHFPLYAGKSYQGEYEMRRPKDHGVFTRTTATATVIGWEIVEVPAGQFRAMRVEVRGQFRRVDIQVDGTISTVFWYAPQVKRFVKIRSETELNGRKFTPIVDELVAYKVQ